jgi:hypothetical protein
MPRPDDEWRSRKTSVHAGDQGVVAAMHIQHIKAVLVENRPDCQHGTHAGTAARARVMYLKVFGLRTDPERRIVGTDEFYVVPRQSAHESIGCPPQRVIAGAEVEGSSKTVQHFWTACQFHRPQYVRIRWHKQTSLYEGGTRQRKRPDQAVRDAYARVERVQAPEVHMDGSCHNQSNNLYGVHAQARRQTDAYRTETRFRTTV